MRSVAKLALWGSLTLVLLLGCSKGPALEPPELTSVANAEPAVPGPIAIAEKPFAIPPRAVTEQRWPAFQELGMAEVTIDALARIGRDAVPELVRLLRESESPKLREQAAQALARMGADAVGATTALTTALDDPDEGVRKNAIRALGQIGPPASKAVPTLVDILKRLDAEAGTEQ